MKKRLLIITPHLSTGGAPQFTLNKIELLKDEYDILCVEYECVSGDFVIQRNKIISLLGDKFISLGVEKLELLNIIKNFNPDFISFEEFPENFMLNNVSDLIYTNKRSYTIFESTHSSLNNFGSKRYFPDKFIFVSKHSEEMYKDLGVDYEIIQYPIEKKPKKTKSSLKKLSLDPSFKHVVNVGLFTEGKNQGYVFEIAEALSNENVMFHFIGNQADNFKDYWEPLMKTKPKNCFLWGERSDVDTFLMASDLFLFTSKFELNPLALKEAMVYDLPILMFNLKTYCGEYDNVDTVNFLSGDIGKDVSLVRKTLNLKVEQTNLSKDSTNTRLDYIETIKNTEITKKVNFKTHYVGNPFFEITGNDDSDFNVSYYVKDELFYSSDIKTNMWVSLDKKYFQDYKIEVLKNGELVYNEQINFENKRVLIGFESSSLGDTIAWIPYVDEFRKKHNCTIIVATFWNYLFEKSYPNLTFVKPGVSINNLHGMYSLGWFYDYNLEPELPNTIPLQKTATNILGLDFKEIKPIIDFTPKEKPYKNKYVTIAPQSTSGLKYWNNENGWDEVVSFLINEGYDVVNVSVEKCNIKNVINIKDTSIKNTMNVIHHSDFLIGLSSGLSWLAWAIDKHVVIISNFTQKDHEFTSNCTRIINESVCNGCWNKPIFKFDKNDWNWCPEHKGTTRQFECHKSITGENVIKKLKPLIK